MSGWRAGGALLSSRANDDKVPTYLPGIQSTLVRVRLLAATFAAAIEASSVGDTQQQQESFRQDLEIHKILWPGLFQGGVRSVERIVPRCSLLQQSWQSLCGGGVLLFNRLPRTIDAAAAVNVHYYLSRGWTVDLVMGRGWADQSEHVSMSKECLHVP